MKKPCGVSQTERSDQSSRTRFEETAGETTVTSRPTVGRESRLCREEAFSELLDKVDQMSDVLGSDDKTLSNAIARVAGLCGVSVVHNALFVAEDMPLLDESIEIGEFYTGKKVVVALTDGRFP